jgi:hypothetical protein
MWACTIGAFSRPRPNTTVWSGTRCSRAFFVVGVHDPVESGGGGGRGGAGAQVTLVCHGPSGPAAWPSASDAGTAAGFAPGDLVLGAWTRP